MTPTPPPAQKRDGALGGDITRFFTPPWEPASVPALSSTDASIMAVPARRGKAGTTRLISTVRAAAAVSRDVLRLLPAVPRSPSGHARNLRNKVAPELRF